MNSSELDEFIENDYELLEDEEWDSFSLLNGNLNNNHLISGFVNF